MDLREGHATHEDDPGSVPPSRDPDGWWRHALLALTLAVGSGAACGVLVAFAIRIDPRIPRDVIGIAIVGAGFGFVMGLPYIAVTERLGRRAPIRAATYPWMAAGLTLASFAAGVGCELTPPWLLLAAFLSPLVAVPLESVLSSRRVRPLVAASSVGGTGFVLWLAAVAWHALHG